MRIERETLWLRRKNQKTLAPGNVGIVAFFALNGTKGNIEDRLWELISDFHDEEGLVRSVSVLFQTVMTRKVVMPVAFCQGLSMTISISNHKSYLAGK